MINAAQSETCRSPINARTLQQRGVESCASRIDRDRQLPAYMVNSLFASATAAVTSMLVAIGGVLTAAPGGGVASAFTLQFTTPHLSREHGPLLLQRTTAAGGFTHTMPQQHEPYTTWLSLRRQQHLPQTALLLLSPQQSELRLRAPRTARSAVAAAAAASRTMTMSLGSMEEQVRPGSLVVFETDVKNSPPALGLVMDRIGKKNTMYTVKPAAPPSGSAAVPLRQIRYIVPGGSAYQASDLPSFEADISVDASLIEEAWEMLLEEGSAVIAETAEEQEVGDLPAGTSDPRSMAELLFGSVQPTPLECYQAYRLLEGREGTLRFKRRRDGTYECRTRDAVQVALHQLKLEDEAKGKKQAFVADLKTRLSAGGGYVKVPLVMEEFDTQEKEMLEGLKSLAVQCVAQTQFAKSTTAQEAAGRELLAMLGRSPSSSNAFHLCVQLKLMKHHENLFLLEAGLGKGFSDEAMKQAKGIVDASPPDPEASTRKDLTHLKIYAVDSEDTMEVDDGFSIENLPDGGGQRIWVHIADVSRWIPEDSPLHLEARRRRATTYLPEGSVPMFPSEVAHGVLSLRAGQECYSLSMSVTLSEDGEITDFTVTPALVKVTYRLTYEDVEDMLATGLAGPESDEWELGRLDELAQLRFSYRCGRGSVDRYQKGLDCIVKATENPEAPGGYDVKVIPEDPSSRSIRLVTEMMVLVGEGMGMVGAKAGIALPYRNQKPPDYFPEEELKALPEKYCRAQGAYRFMSPAVTATTPQQHWGLGLQSYVQWSSPIRRFLDLLAHYQIKRWLAGEEALQGSRIMAEVESGDGMVQITNRVMRKTKKYWVTEYFSRIVGSEMEAYVVSFRDTRDKGGKVIYNLLFQGLGITVPYMENGLGMELGDIVMVKVVASSARSLFTKMSWRRMTDAEKAARFGRSGIEEAFAGRPDDGVVVGSTASRDA